MKKLALMLSIGAFLAVTWIALGHAADGKALYAKCSGCHGADGSKVAIGVGKPLKGMSAEEAAKDLQAYKAKTRPGDKKAIMESQAAKLSD
jgi:cytochrome c